MSSSTGVDLCRENFYKNKERNKTKVSEAHFSTIKNNSDRNSKSHSKHRKQQGMDNKVIKESYAVNTEKPRLFSLKFQSIKPSSNTSKEGRVEKRKTSARSTKPDTTSRALALYGADIDYKGYNKMSSECIIQPRVSRCSENTKIYSNIYFSNINKSVTFIKLLSIIHCTMFYHMLRKLYRKYISVANTFFICDKDIFLFCVDAM